MGELIKMAFGSQGEFNRFMGDYISRLPRNKEDSRGYFEIRQKPKPNLVPKADRTERLVEEELDKVEEHNAGKGFFKRLSGFFFGSKPADDALNEVSDVDEYIEKVMPEPVPSRRPVQPRPAQGISYQSIQRQRPVDTAFRTAQSQNPASKRFEYKPDSDKDFRYLISLVESLIGKMNTAEKFKFLRSSEYRLYQDVKLRR